MRYGNRNWHWEKPYLQALQDCLEKGNLRKSRNGNVVSLFCHQMQFNLKEGFPLLTTKYVNFKLILAELLWFLEGGKNPNLARGEIKWRMSEKRLAEIYERDTMIWEGDAKNFASRGKAQFESDLGVLYGSQWRNWNSEGVDQFSRLINLLKTDPYSRYMRVSAWNPGKLDDMALPACHMDFQCFVRVDKNGVKHLSLHMNQRSADMFLGVPFNIASYALLTHILASICEMEVDRLVITLNDYHVYEPHISQVQTQLARTANPRPKLILNRCISNIDDIHLTDFTLNDYKHQGTLSAKVLTQNI